MIVNTNISSLNAQRNLYGTQGSMQKSLEKLSSGYRINKAADDAAGLAITEKMKGQINGLNQAVRNSQSAISLIQTAEGALNETHSILQRMRELAVQSASDTNTADDRLKLQSEVDQLAKEITRISNTTEFNTQNLLAGGLNDTFHIGANAGQSISLAIAAMDSQTLGVAGSSMDSASFVAGTSGLTGVSNIGRGFSTAAYNIDVTKTAASATAVTRTVGTGAASPTIVDATAYTGAADKAFNIKVVTETVNNVATISVNGAAPITGTAGAGVTTFDLGDGLTISFADGADAAAYVVDDEYEFTANAASATLQLQQGTTNIGSATTVRYGSTSAVVGDATTDKTLTVSYNAFADLTNAQSATFDIVSSASTAATVVNGVVTTEAQAKAGIQISTQSTANAAITAIDTAIKTISEQRSNLGAMQNRLDHTINNLQAASENLSASQSRIRDVDMAAEMSAFTKTQILSQAGVAMLAQANQVPQAVLKLLG